MNKYLFIIAVALISFSSCTQENEFEENVPYTGNFKVSAEFIDLAAGHNVEQAGSLVVNSKEGEVKVKWISDPSFNLDTTQTFISIKGGKGVLPIKWDKKLDNGNYAPEHVWFKAGVLLTSGEEERFIPLYNVQNLDSTKVKESIQTRAGNVSTPRISSIEILPGAPEMGESGANVIVRLMNVQQVVVNYSGIKSSHNIDVNDTNLPTLLTASQNILSFKWKDANVRPAGFVVPIELFASELVNTVNFSLTWNPGASSIPADQYIEVGGAKWAKGNLKYENGTYSFMSSQELFTGVDDAAWNAATNTDYWIYNSLLPSLISLDNGDPCKMVAPVGGWRTPTSAEFEALIQGGNYYTEINGVMGTLFHLKDTSDNQVFLPAAGMVNNYKFVIYLNTPYDSWSFYWTSTSNGLGVMWMRNADISKDWVPSDPIDNIGEWEPGVGFSIRCVVNQ